MTSWTHTIHCDILGSKVDNKYTGVVCLLGKQMTLKTESGQGIIDTTGTEVRHILFVCL